MNMNVRIVVFLVLIIFIGCSKDSSSPSPVATTPTTLPPTGGGNGGGTTATVNFSYERDGVLIEHTTEDGSYGQNHNEPTNKYIESSSSKDSIHNGLTVGFAKIEINVWNLQMDEITLNQEYAFADQVGSAPYAIISYYKNNVGGVTSSYITDSGSSGFVKITDINFTDKTFSGVYEGVLWEEPEYGTGYLIIENGSFTDVRFTNLN
ncbi:hypothetical protein FRY74_11035 [Vicingus serpentipes]|uniref:Uncharacterized protein n=1 Tax=Vicingus serpentipes TaxID=1926625 RepID=A0A5C6RPP6_9FLAO|nr:hypothetical protein [Vicingus serpentipes]TXB64318.1 hypothetical protein FRY74_11035 [Vicingus serpentipes]